MNDLNSKKALRYLLASIMAAGVCGQVNASTVSQTISYGYTQDGQLEKQTIEGSTIHYTDFSLHDKATQVELDGNKIIDYVSFGTNGKTKRIQFADSDYTHGIHRYTDFGALKSMTMVKGGQTVAEKSSLKYNAAGHVTKLYDFHDGKFYTHRFDYNATGNLQSFSINGIANDYYYNDAGALLGKSGMLTGDLSITPVPQRSVDANHQDTAWRYDNDGNLVEDDNYLYKYNSAGRLARVIDKFTLKWVTHYIYDSEGYRVRKMTPSTVTYYYRDVVGNLAQQKSYDIETGRLLNQERYINVNGNNMATVKLEDGEQTLEYQMNDRIGSQAVRWQDGQTAVSQMYSPFGEQMDKRSGRIHAGSYGFTQHEDDNEIQATYMKARYYQPTFGVMTRPDSGRDYDVFNPASFNLYAYVGNNPVNGWDPTGLNGDFTEQIKNDLIDLGHNLTKNGSFPLKAVIYNYKRNPVAQGLMKFGTTVLGHYVVAGKIVKGAKYLKNIKDKEAKARKIRKYGSKAQKHKQAMKDASQGLRPLIDKTKAQATQGVMLLAAADVAGNYVETFAFAAAGKELDINVTASVVNQTGKALGLDQDTIDILQDVVGGVQPGQVGWIDDATTALTAAHFFDNSVFAGFLNNSKIFGEWYQKSKAGKQALNSIHESINR